MLIAHPQHEDQAWAYLIAFGNDVRQATSFADLVALGDVEKMLSREGVADAVTFAAGAKDRGQSNRLFDFASR